MKISLLKDNFNELNGGVWSVEGTNEPVFSGGEVELNDSYMYTNSLYELTGSSVFIELKDLTIGINGDEVECLDVDDESNWYSFGVRLVEGVETVYLYEYSGGFVSYTDGGAYNPSVHKYFRIREADGTLYFEYSPDLKTWGNAISPVEEPVITTDYVRLYIGAFDDSASVTLDNLNITNTPVIGTKYSMPAFKSIV